MTVEKNINKGSLRIVHLSTARECRGGELQSLLLIKGLRDRDHENVLVCPPNTPLEEEARELGIIVHCLPLKGEVDLYSSFRLRLLLNRYCPHILHAHTSHAQLIGGLACIGSQCLNIASRRVDFHVKNSLSRWIKYRILVDGIIAVSEAVREILIRDGISPEKVVAIRSGCDPSRFNSIRGNGSLRNEFGGDDAFIVLNVAALVGHKDHETLLRAAALVKDRYPQARFLIAGEGKLREKLAKLSSELGLEDIVKFLGFRTDIAELFSISDVLLHTSKEEGLGTSLIDALFMGLPIVATRAGGIPEIVKDGYSGFLVPVGDFHQVAKKLARLIEEHVLLKKLSEGARLSANSFHIDKTVEKTEEFYKEIIHFHER